jgi:hypothetical protein
MSKDELRLPAPEVMRQHVLSALKRYWHTGQFAVEGLPIRLEPNASIILPLRMVSVQLPEWGCAAGVDGEILVPQEAFNVEGDWRHVDWWLAAFLMLECWHERAWEQRHGPIHSYSFRLKGWDDRVWGHAWVNRIALFLRLWAMQIEGKSAEHLLSPLPQSKILVTHDVDAITKTLQIRIKQGGFNLFNALRALLKLDPNTAYAKSRKALRFLFGSEDWWTLDALLDLEVQNNLHARYHFYADFRRKTPQRWLFDPSYSVDTQRLKRFFRRLVDSGAEIGLHPSFDSWQESILISQQKNNLDAVVGRSNNSCRQHWLRFSWRKTWAAQEAAGLDRDATLMFNDRPGLRSSSAVSWHPWHAELCKAHQLLALPTVMMDSHFYDYQSMMAEDRRLAIKRWVKECREVSGEIAVLWHPHALTNDYGWSEGFKELIAQITKD